jgi:hypothetical protein
MLQSTLPQDILHPSHHLLNVLLQIANKLGLSNKKNHFFPGRCRATGPCATILLGPEGEGELLEARGGLEVRTPVVMKKSVLWHTAARGFLARHIVRNSGFFHNLCWGRLGIGRLQAHLQFK